ncbi:hypothetical protein TSMEX_006979 [Taenia solium]|eukprot:TsM_000202000 transcript=TsM_000202000 gene=TsM_000202000
MVLPRLGHQLYIAISVFVEPGKDRLFIGQVTSLMEVEYTSSTSPFHVCLTVYFHAFSMW